MAAVIIRQTNYRIHFRNQFHRHWINVIVSSFNNARFHRDWHVKLHPNFKFLDIQNSNNNNHSNQLKYQHVNQQKEMQFTDVPEFHLI